jgi:glycerol-3-phosphate dehydrogenase
MPRLAQDVRAVAEYYDARISHPERLVMELAADAEEDCPEAMALPYLCAGGQSAGRIDLKDHLTGETFEVTPRIVVNATGAWVDDVQNRLGFAGRLMGGTRGTHLAMRLPELSSALGGRMLYFETYDQRACLVLPLDETIVYVGTTDIRVEAPDENHYTEAEIDYIFEVLKPILPDVTFRREDIVFAMAGVRPLPYQDVGATGAISRGHRLDVHEETPDRPFRTFTLVGGKWTTYRAFGEEVTDEILEAVGRTRRTSTQSLPIGGARGLPADPSERADFTRALSAEIGLPAERCFELVSRYGARARTIAAAERASNASFATVDGYSPAEIDHICRAERVSKLEDVVLRRTLMAFEGRVSREGLQEVASVAGTALGWDAHRQAAERDACADLLRERHRVPLKDA